MAFGCLAAHHPKQALSIWVQGSDVEIQSMWLLTLPIMEAQVREKATARIPAAKAEAEVDPRSTSTVAKLGVARVTARREAQRQNAAAPA